MSEEICEDENCSMHNRVDCEKLIRHMRYGLIVSYVGEWAVVTDDNLDDVPTAMEIKSIQDLLDMADHLDEINSPNYEIRVYKVGEGALLDLGESIDGSYHEHVYFSYKHSDYDYLVDMHHDVVDDLVRGKLDLSRSLMDQEMDEMLGWK